MQRLNVKLVVWLVVTVIVLGVGWVFLHRHQLQRTAAKYKAAAEKDESDGQLDEALKLYKHYLSLQHDDIDAWEKFALCAADVAERPGATRNDYLRAHSWLEQTLRQDPSRHRVRYRLTVMSLAMGRFHDAKEHIQHLLDAEAKIDRSPEDLKLMLAQCHQYMGEFPQASELYEQVIAEAPDTVEAYARYANLLVRRYAKSNGAERAAECLDKMVEENANNAQAYLFRSRYYRQLAGAENAEKARNDIEEALLKAPNHEDPNVLKEALLMAAQLEINQRNFDKGREYATRVEQEFPDEEQGYLTSSRLDYISGKREESIAALRRGLDRLPDSVELNSALAQNLLAEGDYAAVEELLKDLERLKASPAVVDFLRAKKWMGEGRWVQASQMLERIRPLVVAVPSMSNLALHIDLALADCYERLGRPDLHMNALESVLERNPNSFDALLKLADVHAGRGHHKKALDAYKAIEKTFKAKLSRRRVGVTIPLVMAQPEELRDWTEVDGLLDEMIAEKPNQIETHILKMRVMELKGEGDAANELLGQLFERYPNSLSLGLMVVSKDQRENGVKAAMARLDEMEERLGDSVSIRAARARLVTAFDNENEAKDVLAKQAQGLDGFNKDEKVSLMAALANAYFRIGDVETAKGFFRDVAKEDPLNLQVRKSWFEMCKDSLDSVGMETALESIKELVGGTNDSFWQYGEAARLAVLVQNQEADPAILAEARRHVTQARQQRPDWPALAGLDGQIHELEGKQDDAIALYQKAIENDSSDFNIYRRLIRLLHARERDEDAAQVIDKLPEQVKKSPQFRSLVAENLLARNRAPEAIELFSDRYDEESENWRDHAFMGQMMVQAGDMQRAEEAFRRAVEVESGTSATWIPLIQHYTRIGKMDEAREAIAEMKLKLPAEQLSLSMAQCSEFLRDYIEAEAYYQAAVREKPDDLAFHRALADFYLRMKQMDKAEQVLSKIVRMERENPRGNYASGVWARRRLAQVLASSGEFQDLKKAEKLLYFNAGKDGKLLPEDEQQLAWIKGRQPTIKDRKDAIEEYERILDQDPSDHRSRYRVALLYERNRNWDKCRNYLQLCCVERPEIAEYLRTYIRLLLKHDDVATASRFMDELEQLMSDPPAAVDVELQARVFVNQGDAAAAIEEIMTLVPRPLPPDQIDRLMDVGRVLESLSYQVDDEQHKERLLDAAEEMYREFADNNKERGALVQATFYGRHGQLDRALELCESSIGEQPIQTVSTVAIDALRNNRLVAEKSHYDKVRGWVQQTLDDNPTDVAASFHMAELYDLQANYKEATRIYRTLLTRSDLSNMQRATALNNLAFILAMLDNNWQEARPMIDEAINLVGGLSELLDTRAMVSLSKGDINAALNDLQDAIDDTASGAKFFHLALAYDKAGDPDSAATALEDARDQGFNSNMVAPLERRAFEELRKRVAVDLNAG